MPAYNAAKYIHSAISSVLAQTYADFELLIVDDGSTDDTVAIIRTFSDNRIRLIQKEHSGISPTLNRGLLEATGEYIARFDADDICLPLRLERQLAYLEQYPSCLIVGSEAEYMAENGDHLFHFRCIGYSHEQITAVIKKECPFIHSAVMYRKGPVLELGGYSALTGNFEDYLLWIQLSRYGEYHNLAEPLIRVRFNPDSVTIDEKWRGRRFRELKRKIIAQGFVTEAEGAELHEILRKQNVQRIKKASYYALCGKKYLLNNHQPRKARTQLRTSMKYYPYRLDNYGLYLLSFFPKSFIHWLHKNWQA